MRRTPHELLARTPACWTRDCGQVSLRRSLPLWPPFSARLVSLTTDFRSNLQGALASGGAGNGDSPCPHLCPQVTRVLCIPPGSQHPFTPSNSPHNPVAQKLPATRFSSWRLQHPQHPGESVAASRVVHAAVSPVVTSPPLDHPGATCLPQPQTSICLNPFLPRGAGAYHSIQGSHLAAFPSLTLHHRTKSSVGQCSPRRNPGKTKKKPDF